MRAIVLPLVGFHPVGTGSFSLLVFPPLLGDEPSSDVLYVEQLTRDEVFVDEDAEVYEYRLAFSQLLQHSPTHHPPTPAARNTAAAAPP
ncbi:MAG TPA: Scr1 family TA system antitoxin-like transcriptional regulator [Streptosporangiaceae bacterium]|nr:Scr1 family TA system antitoxin-like transcriptional regulator [Streptosporangiaceae bacterium]